MFTDMVGYTALSQADEALSVEVLARHNRLLRPIFTTFRGREIKTIGDSFLVEFHSALDATNCAVEIQRFLHDYNFSSKEEWRIRLRIGIHLGDVIHTDGDVLGDAVNIASRIEPLAEAEGVCVSEQVFDQVRNKILQPFVKLTQKDLKNIRFSIDVYKVVLPWESDTFSGEKHEIRATPRLAVLPFANMSPDPQDEFFADGLTEEMITELSKIPSLRVIARTSVMHYKNPTKGILEIGRELRVGSILEGSVRKAGNKIRITAQLIDAISEEHLWADKYDRELNDIFSVQSEIATNVAGALQIKLLARKGPGKQTESLEAYTLYLRGRFLWNKRSAKPVREALQLFERALVMDPGYARAYSGIADCYSVLADMNEMSWAEAGSKARDACEKALELNDSLPEAHASFGLTLTRELDYEGAEREFKKATELNPGYASAYQWYCMMLLSVGRMDEAGMAIAKAEEADPLSPVILANSGYYEWINGRDDRALEKWTRGLEVDPGLAVLHFDKAAYYAKRSMKEEALAELKQLDSPSSEDRQRSALSAFLYGYIGERDEAKRRLQSLLAEANERTSPAARVAWAYAGLGDVDGFYKWALKSVEDRSFFPLLLRTHPLLEKMRADPRYKDFMDGWRISA